MNPTQLTLLLVVRACYQHACLCLVSDSRMTNPTLPERMGVDPQNYAVVSRIIRDTISAGLVKAHDPNDSKRFMHYHPFWA